MIANIAFESIQSKIFPFFSLLANGMLSYLYWAVSQTNSLTFQANPGSDSGSTSACLWPWSEGTPPAYWPVCKFDL